MVPALRTGQPKRGDAAGREGRLTKPELHYRPSRHGESETLASHKG